MANIRTFTSMLTVTNTSSSKVRFQGRLKVKCETTCHFHEEVMNLSSTSQPCYIQLKGSGCFDGYSSESLSLQGRLKVTNTSSRLVSGCGRPPIVIIMLDQKIAEIIALLPQNKPDFLAPRGHNIFKHGGEFTVLNMTWPEDGVRVRVDRVVMDRPVFTAYTTCTQRSLQRNRASIGIVLKCPRLYILAN